MRIGIIFYDMQEFGGLEEYAVSLAISLQKKGNQVNVVSTAWVSPDNQYLNWLQQNRIPIIQLPKWISDPATDWPTKEKLLSGLMWLFTPIVSILALVLSVFRRKSWGQSRTSAHGWLREKFGRFIGPDWRKPIARLLLSWWQYRWKPEILHIQGYTSSLLFVIEWAHQKGIPVVYEEHQTPDAQFDWWHGFRETINKAARVVAVSERSAEALRTVCGVTQPIIIRNPLLADPMSSGWIKLPSLRDVNEPISVTTVARLSVTKGLNFLLEAIVKVKVSHPTTIFRVYGDGELYKELLCQADQLGLDGQALFVGSFTNRAELHRIMNETDIFVMSSVLEGQPLALVEAMSYGCPIVATRVGGIPELIQDGINGLLCVASEPECLAKKICTLIEDNSLRQRLGQAARQSYELGPYQPTAVSEHLYSIYQEVLTELH